MIPRGRVLLEEELDLISLGEWRDEMDELLKRVARIEPGGRLGKKTL